MSGWVKLHRSLLDWEWFDDHNTFRLFATLLLMANHKQQKWRGIMIEKGSMVTSLDSLSKKTGLSVRKIRTSLDKLILTGELTSASNNKFRIISISNWDKYQSDDKQVDNQETSKRQADDKQATTNKNVKNDNNVKNKDISTEPTIGSIPTNKADEVFEVKESFADEMQKLYPAVNVRQEVNKMIAWSMTNKSKRKTYNGMPKFINNWLSKQQDKGGQNGTSGQVSRKNAGDINDDWFEGLKNM